MGISDSFWPNYDDFDPWILYQRGLYFFHSQVTYGNSAPAPFYLGNSHTFDMFIYVMQANGTILFVNDQTSPYVSLTTTHSSNSYQLALMYSITNLQTPSPLLQTFSLTSGF